MNRFEVHQQKHFLKFLGSYDTICNEGGFSRNLVDGKTWRQSTLNKIYNIFLYQSRLDSIPSFSIQILVEYEIISTYLIILFCSFAMSPQIVFVRANTQKDCCCCSCAKLITLLIVHILYSNQFIV